MTDKKTTAMSRTRWTDSENRHLTEMYHEGVPLPRIADKLGRSENAVLQHLTTIGEVSRNPRQPWTDDDDNIIREMAGQPGVTDAMIAERLGNRKAPSVTKRRIALGLSTSNLRPWTEADDDKLTEMRNAGTSIADIATELDRTPAAVQARASKLGLVKRQEHARMNDKMRERGAELFNNGLTITEVARALDVSYATAHKLHCSLFPDTPMREIRPWTADDIEYLTNNYATETTATIAAELGRTTPAVVARASQMGLHRRQNRELTEIDDARLTELWSGMASATEVAHELGTTRNAVIDRARTIGLVRAQERWTADALSELYSMVNDGASVFEIAEKLGYSETSVRSRINRARADGDLPHVRATRAKREAAETAEAEVVKVTEVETDDAEAPEIEVIKTEITDADVLGD